MVVAGSDGVGVTSLPGVGIGGRGLSFEQLVNIRNTVSTAVMRAFLVESSFFMVVTSLNFSLNRDPDELFL